jgi:hypothetical protein
LGHGAVRQCAEKPLPVKGGAEADGHPQFVELLTVLQFGPNFRH